MPNYPKPFFRSTLRLWYVQIDGKQHNLGPDRSAAFAAYHLLMQQSRETQKVPDHAVAVLIDQFLEWVQQHRTPVTYIWYQFRIQEFVNRWPSLVINELKPFHVQEWIDSFKATAPGTKRNYARSIMRCMTWCEEQGLIDRSPIRFFKKPRAGKREQIITPENTQRFCCRSIDRHSEIC